MTCLITWDGLLFLVGFYVVIRLIEYALGLADQLLFAIREWRVKRIIRRKYQ